MRSVCTLKCWDLRHDSWRCKISLLKVYASNRTVILFRRAHIGQHKQDTSSFRLIAIKDNSVEGDLGFVVRSVKPGTHFFMFYHTFCLFLLQWWVFAASPVAATHHRAKCLACVEVTLWLASCFRARCAVSESERRRVRWSKPVMHLHFTWLDAGFGI